MMDKTLATVLMKVRALLSLTGKESWMMSAPNLKVCNDTTIVVILHAITVAKDQKYKKRYLLERSMRFDALI